MDSWRHMNLRLRFLNFLHGVTKRERRRQVERERDGWIECLVIHRERSVSRLIMSERAERNDFAWRIRRHIDVIQSVWALRVLRLHFENDMVLVEAFIDI